MNKEFQLKYGKKELEFFMRIIVDPLKNKEMALTKKILLLTTSLLFIATNLYPLDYFTVKSNNMYAYSYQKDYLVLLERDVGNRYIMLELKKFNLKESGFTKKVSININDYVNKNFEYDPKAFPNNKHNREFARSHLEIYTGLKRIYLRIKNTLFFLDSKLEIVKKITFDPKIFKNIVGKYHYQISDEKFPRICQDRNSNFLLHRKLKVFGLNKGGFFLYGHNTFLDYTNGNIFKVIKPKTKRVGPGVYRKDTLMFEKVNGPSYNIDLSSKYSNYYRIRASENRVIITSYRSIYVYDLNSRDLTKINPIERIKPVNDLFDIEAKNINVDHAYKVKKSDELLVVFEHEDVPNRLYYEKIKF